MRPFDLSPEKLCHIERLLKDGPMRLRRLWLHHRVFSEVEQAANSAGSASSSGVPHAARPYPSYPRPTPGCPTPRQKRDSLTQAFARPCLSSMPEVGFCLPSAPSHPFLPPQSRRHGLTCSSSSHSSPIRPPWRSEVRPGDPTGGTDAENSVRHPGEIDRVGLQRPRKNILNVDPRDRNEFNSF